MKLDVKLTSVSRQAVGNGRIPRDPDVPKIEKRTWTSQQAKGDGRVPPNPDVPKNKK